jgi:hypothetical protein
MSAQITFIHDHVHVQAFWILVLAALIFMIVTAIAVVVWGHPLVTGPVQLPHPLPGPMA